MTCGLAAGASSRTSFADGSWKGTARFSQSIEGIAVVASSTFTMKVRGGRVSGTLISKGSASGTSQGQRVVITMSGHYPLTGSASGPVGRGLLRFSGRVQGKLQTQSGAVVNTFARLRGTCARMTGKIVLTAAKPDPSSTGPDSVSAPFVATRLAGSGPAC